MFLESTFTVNAASIISEIQKLSMEDRVVLVQRIWDDIAESNLPLNLTEAQKAELDRRSAELDANPDMAIPWDEVKQNLQMRLRR